jgi:hypothetical protein
MLNTIVLIIFVSGLILLNRQVSLLASRRQSTLSKTQLNHPGSQLQFKFSPIKFLDHSQETNAVLVYLLRHGGNGSTKFV